jgi:predicted DNA-binding protein
MLNIRLTHALRERLRVIAESEHRTMSQEVRRLIERHVAAADEDETS